MNDNKLFFRVESGPCFEALVEYKNALHSAETAHLEYAKSVGGCRRIFWK